MLAERAKQWPQQWMAEGRQEGHREGLEEGLHLGRVKGLRETLKLQLELKFGELSPEIAERLQGASDDDLLLWLQRLLNAASTDDIFA